MANSSSGSILKINRDFQERATRERAAKLGFEYVDVAEFPINLDILKIISAEESEKAELFPFEKIGKKLRVAIVEPSAAETKKLFAELQKKYELEVYICSRDGFDRALKNYDVQILKKHSVAVRDQVEEHETKLESTLQNFAELEKKISNLPAKSALAEIEVESVAIGASDIHFQPVVDGVVLRLRVDGVLHDALRLSPEIAESLISRIKFESGMKSNISDAPQDGHAAIRVNGRLVDLRVSTLPTPTLESVVMRVLDSNRGIRTFSELGFAPHAEEKILKSLHQKNGIVLVTGPTGSGKTTTLYSMLAELNLPEQKLVTLEDPIEYHLPGVSQSQVNEDRAYNFETGFKSLLRHDPDVILVGEVRTIGTARLAFEAALTGHTVLSSLHTNSAIGAVSRLRNMGMENYNIAPTVNAVFAQKLVRRVCPHCAGEQPISVLQKAAAAELQNLQRIFPDLKFPEKIPVAVGCEKCSNTGFHDQIAICEAFFVTDEIREMILHGDSEIKILQFLRENSDFLTLREDGILKVLSGITTFDEVQRVAGEKS
ncbi:type II/IV secretion system protein [bacterium]|nr:type II/IV secretion system protein [bacterium]MBT6832328.1 type II/IV secretion system protein [bacterium]MBT6996773.1 type II/IV secretion system protein [bacterium]MBT7772814.1 type II/IV secretion system protein [bacterium]